MMFPKPAREPKEKKKYNSLQQRNNKPKKEVAPWRQGIVSHHESKPSRADRAEFSNKIVSDLIAEADGKCQCGCGRPDQSTHHVMPRGRNGRGVKTNGMRVNNICHDRIQTNEDELRYWIGEWEKKYGPNFWFDEQDWQEYNHKQAVALELEQEKQLRTERIEPIVNLITAAAGRTLKAKELRLLDGMDDKEIAVFAQMMHDIIGTNVRNELPFGYGHFDD